MATDATMATDADTLITAGFNKKRATTARFKFRLSFIVYN
jgi:hypothetical protein